MEYLKKATNSAEQNSSEARKIVEGILADIRTNGEDAVRAIAKKFDKWDQEFVLTPEKKARLIAQRAGRGKTRYPIRLRPDYRLCQGAA